MPLLAMIALSSIGGCRVAGRPCSVGTRDARDARAPGLVAAKRLHLGDGVHTDNYFFIGAYLAAHAGSAKQTADVEQRQRAAQQTSGASALKPPSANVVESELSHLLGAVARSNGGVGAAVFDAHRLKVAASGVQLEAMVLSGARDKAAVARRADDRPLVVRHSCAELEKRSRGCDPAATRGVPCWQLERLVRPCKGALVALYRPVLDHDADPPRVLGVSMIVVEERAASGASTR